MITTKAGTKTGIREKKEAAVKELAGKFESANAVYLADFTGLSVKRVTELRSRLRQAGVEYIVVKNTLAERALQGMDYPDISEHFVGPTAVVFGPDDPVAAAKVLADFARTGGAALANVIMEDFAKRLAAEFSQEGAGAAQTAISAHSVVWRAIKAKLS